MKFDPDCYICNAARHLCPGCGASTDHETITCSACTQWSLCNERWEPCYQGTMWSPEGLSVPCVYCLSIARLCLEFMLHVKIEPLAGEWWITHLLDDFLQPRMVNT